MNFPNYAEIVEAPSTIPLGSYLVSTKWTGPIIRTNRYPAVPPKPHALDQREEALAHLMARAIDLVIMFELPPLFHRMVPGRGYPWTAEEIRQVRDAAFNVPASESAKTALNEMARRRKDIDPAAYHYCPEERVGPRVIPEELRNRHPSPFHGVLRDPAEILAEEGIPVFLRFQTAGR